MPTARPIISASVGVEVFTSVNAATASTPDIAMPTPRIAVRIGMPAASSEPKVSASTTSATRTPIPSVTETCTDLLVKIWPPRCTSSGESSGSARAAFSRSSMVRVLEPVQRHVELHLDQGVAAVVGAESLFRLVNGSVATWTWSTLLDRGRRPGAPRPVVADLLALRRHEQHLARGAGDLGEALREDVEPVLRLGAGDRQVVLQLTAQADGERAHQRPGRAPTAPGRASRAVHGVPEPVEERRHSIR